MAYNVTELMRVSERLQHTLSLIHFASDFNDVLPEAEIEDSLRDFIEVWNASSPQHAFTLTTTPGKKNERN